MNQKRKKEIGIVLLLVLVVVAMTVGFAAYTQRLNITGNVTVKGSPWKVAYVTSGEGTITTTSGSVTANPQTVSDTDFAFTITLNKPGDFYEANLTVKNFGTINAQLKQITMSTLTADQQKYLTYSITYNNGTAVTATTSNDLNIALNAGATAPVKVRVEYKSNALQEDLPANEQTITVTGNLDYESV